MRSVALRPMVMARSAGEAKRSPGVTSREHEARATQRFESVRQVRSQSLLKRVKPTCFSYIKGKKKQKEGKKMPTSLI